MDLALLLPVVMVVLVLAWQPVEVLVSPVDLQRVPVARDLCKRERPAWDHHHSVSATLLDLRRRLALLEFNRLSLVVRNQLLSDGGVVSIISRFTSMDEGRSFTQNHSHFCCSVDAGVIGGRADIGPAEGPRANVGPQSGPSDLVGPQEGAKNVGGPRTGPAGLVGPATGPFTSVGASAGTSTLVGPSQGTANLVGPSVGGVNFYAGSGNINGDDGSSGSAAAGAPSALGGAGLALGGAGLYSGRMVKQRQ